MFIFSNFPDFRGTLKQSTRKILGMEGESFSFSIDFHVTALFPDGIAEAIPKLREALQSEKLFQANEDWCSNNCLRRFLIARNLDIEKAKEMILSALDWRNNRKPHEISAQEPWLEDEGRTGKINCPGFDKWGRPVVVFDNSVQNTKDPEKQLSFLAFNLEFAVREMGVSSVANVEKYVIFMHMYNFSLFNQPSMAVTMETIKMVSTCYPERLGHIVVYQPPRIFKVFYDMVCPFVDERTKSKVFFINGDTSPGSTNDKHLMAVIGPGWRELCGAEQPTYEKKCTPGYKHSEYWPALIRRQQAHLKMEQPLGDGKSAPEPIGKAPISIVPRKNLKRGSSFAATKSERQKLRAFYEKYNPKKIKEMDKVLQKFAGREAEMYQLLFLKYKVPEGSQSDFWVQSPVSTVNGSPDKKDSFQNVAGDPRRNLDEIFSACERKKEADHGASATIKKGVSKKKSKKWTDMPLTWTYLEAVLLPLILGIIITLICL